MQTTRLKVVSGALCGLDLNVAAVLLNASFGSLLLKINGSCDNEASMKNTNERLQYSFLEMNIVCFVLTAQICR